MHGIAGPGSGGNLSDYLGCSVLGSVSPSLVKISTCSMLVRWGQIVSASFYSPHCNTSFECSEAVAPQSCLRIGCGFLSVSRDHRSCCSILFWFLFWGHSQQHSGLSLGSALRNTFVSAQGTVFIWDARNRTLVSYMQGMPAELLFQLLNLMF